MTEDSENLTVRVVEEITIEPNVDTERQCWVCFATDEDDTNAAWVRPCCCKGTSKWVHQRCLQRWVDEKQKGNPMSQVSCPQCNTTYIIVFPNMGPIVLILDSINSLIYRACPFIAAGLLVGSTYWVAVTYGAVTVMQVMGHEAGQTYLELADPLVLLVALPAIPVVLIMGKMIQWEDYVLRFLRRNIRSVPMLKYVLPSLMQHCSDSNSEETQPMFTDPVSATRVFCSALVFPTMAVFMGRVFFHSVRPHLQRSAMGAVVFLACKGALKLYHKQQMFVRQCQRKILNFDGHSTSSKSVPPSTASQT